MRAEKLTTQCLSNCRTRHSNLDWLQQVVAKSLIAACNILLQHACALKRLLLNASANFVCAAQDTDEDKAEAEAEDENEDETKQTKLLLEFYLQTEEQCRTYCVCDMITSAGNSSYRQLTFEFVVFILIIHLFILKYSIGVN